MRTIEARQAEEAQKRRAVLPYIVDAAHALVVEGVLESPELSDVETNALTAMVAGLGGHLEDRNEDDLRWDIIQAPWRQEKAYEFEPRHLALNSLKNRALELREAALMHADKRV